VAKSFVDVSFGGTSTIQTGLLTHLLALTITLDRGTCKHAYILDFTRAVRAVKEMKHSKRRFFHRMPPKTALSLFDMHARCIPTQNQ